jgi:hypothetical protein
MILSMRTALKGVPAVLEHCDPRNRGRGFAVLCSRRCDSHFCTRVRALAACGVEFINFGQPIGSVDARRY